MPFFLRECETMNSVDDEIFDIVITISLLCEWNFNLFD